MTSNNSDRYETNWWHKNLRINIDYNYLCGWNKVSAFSRWFGIYRPPGRVSYIMPTDENSPAQLVLIWPNDEQKYLFFNYKPLFFFWNAWKSNLAVVHSEGADLRETPCVTSTQCSAACGLYACVLAYYTRSPVVRYHIMYVYIYIYVW